MAEEYQPPQQLSQEDRRILSRHLSPEQWDAVSKAGVGIAAVDTIRRSDVGTASHLQLSSSERDEMILVALRVALVGIERALTALAPLIGEHHGDQSAPTGQN